MHQHNHTSTIQPAVNVSVNSLSQLEDDVEDTKEQVSVIDSGRNFNLL